MKRILDNNEAKRTPLDVTNINEKVYSLIKERITNLEYPPGYKIVVPRLQAELGVSNSPIKSALFRLAGEELVEITSRKGTIVKDISKSDILEIEEFRTIIEIGAVDILARIITKEQITILEQLYQETLFSNCDFNYSEFMKKDSLFHIEIIKMTGNNRLLNAYKRLNAHIQLVRFQATRKPIKPLPWTNMDHMAIIDALKMNDPIKSMHVIKDHRRKAQNAFMAKRKKRSNKKD